MQLNFSRIKFMQHSDYIESFFIEKNLVNKNNLLLTAKFKVALITNFLEEKLLSKMLKLSCNIDTFCFNRIPHKLKSDRTEIEEYKKDY
ncbi:hypothetical protein BpHYR1_045000 [Brachionus plicatilis]|uniref:Uncharacterized protein n=1 Tax=Brachionus plicatilis TaxID=10195 RepID=A0A3M7QED2_BRAPC|nr:hypothetical protein BpHYR1_045000 [Brachionus plicatilis]